MRGGGQAFPGAGLRMALGDAPGGRRLGPALELGGALLEAEGGSAGEGCFLDESV